MAGEVIDTNVLVVASAALAADEMATPVKDPRVLQRVYEWVKAFRGDDDRRLVMDRPEQTIRAEYQRNLPRESYGRRVLVDKFTRCAVEFVALSYWSNGAERVAQLPDARLDGSFHDLGDRKLVAAAHGAGAPIINATDGDWTEPLVKSGLDLLGVAVIQLLGDDERRALRART